MHCRRIRLDIHAVVMSASTLFAILGIASRAAGQVTLNSIDRGWYTSDGLHLPSNENYVVGDSDASDGLLFRNWFLFDLATIQKPVTAATLKIYNPPNGYASGNASETITFFNVSTSFSALVAGSSGLTTYNDLGSGLSYGSKGVGAPDNSSTIPFVLNSNALADITAQRGSLFAIGGAITTLDGTDNTEFLFGFSGNITPQLDLTLADSIHWQNPSGGTWQTPSNWEFSFVPDSTTNAIFNLPGSTYTVNFSSAAAAKAIDVSSGNVTFNLAGNTLAAQDRVVVGGFTAGNGTLNLIGSAGSTVTTTYFDIGSNLGNGVLTLNATTLSTSLASQDNYIGGSGLNGRITLTNGAKLLTAGTILLDDSGANNSTGTLEVLSGSLVTAPTIKIASRSGAMTGQAASLLVDNAAVSVTGNLSISGSATAQGAGSGTVTIQNGGSVTVGGITKVWNNGRINLTGGKLTTGTLDLTNSASRLNWTGGTLGITNSEVHIAGTATANTSWLGSNVTIDGDMALTTSSSSFVGIGTSPGNATLTLADGGSVTARWTDMGSTFGAPGARIARLIVSSSFPATPSTYTLSQNLAVGGDFNTVGDTGLVTIGFGGVVNVAQTTKVLNGGGGASRINLVGGTLRTGTLDTAGVLPRFYDHWTAGTLELTASGLDVGTGYTLGNTISLPGGVNAKSLIASGNIFIGRSSNGTLSVTGGLIESTNGALVVGYGGGGVGVATLSAGTIASANDFDIGISAAGTFTQTGGRVSIGHTFNVGSGGTGTAVLSGGSLSSTGLIVGAAGGSGTMTINGGSVGVLGTATVTSTGRLLVSGGSLTTQGLDAASAASFSFTGGTITIDGGRLIPRTDFWTTASPASGWSGLQISGVGASESTLRLHGGATMSASINNLMIGHSGNKGSMLIDGSLSASTFNIGNIIIVGHGRNASLTTPSQGTLSISDGGKFTVTSSAAVFVGNEGGAGSVSVAGDNSAFSSAGALFVGYHTLHAGPTNDLPSEGVASFASGGQGTFGYAMVGADGGKGHLNLNGTNGKVVINSDMFAGTYRESGHAFTSGSVTVSNGATLSIGSNMYIGRQSAVGSLTVDAGRVAIGSDFRVGEFNTGFGAAAGTVSILNGGTLVSNTAAIGSSAGNGTVTLSGVGSSWTNNLTLSVGNGGGGTVAVTNNARLNAATLLVGTGGQLSLASGATIQVGTLNLSGAASRLNWTGGTLRINSSAPAADGLLTVPNGGTLGGSGEIARPTSVAAGGAIAPGNSPGTMTFSADLTLSTGSELVMEIGTPTPGTGYDQIIMTSGATLAANGAQLKLIAMPGIVTGVPYTIVNATAGAISGSFKYLTTDLLQGGPYNEPNVTFSIDYTSSMVRVTFSAVPEPSGLVPIFAAGMFLKRTRRRR